MADNLVIVESPAKAKTIEKYLGNEFKVASSFGHISDLPSKNIGIDIENDFKPNYEVSSDKKTVVKNLKDLVKKSKTVWLASDEDREGEAIAWHLFRTLKLNADNTKRIVFNEITKSAITNAVNNPRSINYNLVDAQQARRVLDRIVGYELSPVLWRKVKGGLSAGRVQSVAVRLLVEKEREIRDYVSTSSFKIEAIFKNSKGKEFIARLSNEFNSKEDAVEFLNNSNGATFSVSEIVKKPLKKSAPAPFTTSTLQQEASRKLSFPVSKTMSVAQRLYESGHITYMRTDSVNLSSLAIDEAKKQVITAFGESYSNPKNYNTKSKSAQQAHEAVRPTNFSMSVDSIKDYDQKRLYSLILNRTLASQMKPAELEKTNIKISNSKDSEIFFASGEVIKFDGYLKLYQVSKDDDNGENDGILPGFNENEVLELCKIFAQQKFSRPPYRYSEASLVKKLEELGIGRPSTYAPTIKTVQDRGYVEIKDLDGIDRSVNIISLVNNEITKTTQVEKVGADRKKMIPTTIGEVVNEFLSEHFVKIMDYNFTADIEKELDAIASGQLNWSDMLQKFYKPFHKNVIHTQENAERANGERFLGDDPATGEPVFAKLGKYGPIIQIGDTKDEDKKPRFASLKNDQNIKSIDLQSALNLFEYPKLLGHHDGDEVFLKLGRFGPYIQFAKSNVSIPKDMDVDQIDMQFAIELIQKKKEADAPIHHYEGSPVTKGKGRFGPFIKWNNIFINVNKKYDFDNLSEQDIVNLIEEKKQKEKEKLIHNWENEGITVEKGRWGKVFVISGKKRKQLDVKKDPKALTLEEAKTILKS